MFMWGYRTFPHFHLDKLEDCGCVALVVVPGVWSSGMIFVSHAYKAVIMKGPGWGWLTLLRLQAGLLASQAVHGSIQRLPQLP